MNTGKIKICSLLADEGAKVVADGYVMALADGLEEMYKCAFVYCAVGACSDAGGTPDFHLLSFEERAHITRTYECLLNILTVLAPYDGKKDARLTTDEANKIGGEYQCMLEAYSTGVAGMLQSIEDMMAVSCIERPLQKGVAPTERERELFFYYKQMRVLLCGLDAQLTGSAKAAA